VDDRALPTINLDRCTSCGLCVEYCPTDAVEMAIVRPTGHKPAIVRPQSCAYCGLCVEMCPVGAITLAYEIVLPPTSE